jgi:hypothetical protein
MPNVHEPHLLGFDGPENEIGIAADRNAANR